MLCASGCSAGYGSRPVLAGIDIEVARGEILTIVGPSGSGKSTLLMVLAGLIRPQAGSVTFAGRPLGGPDRRIGLVLQQYGLFPWFTVLQNVTLGLAIRRRTAGSRSERGLRESRHATEGRAREVIARLGLSGKESRYPRELSGGEQQRVALARTLVLRPELLLLDEPFSALDALTREELQDRLLDLLREEGLAAVLVTHSIDEAVYLGERVGILAGAPARLSIEPNPAGPRHHGSDGRRRLDRRYLRQCALARGRFTEAAGA